MSATDDAFARFLEVLATSLDDHQASGDALAARHAAPPRAAGVGGLPARHDDRRGTHALGRLPRLL